MSTEPHRIVPLEIADLATVLNGIFPCRAKWYNLGVQLRVDVSKLDCFMDQYTDPRDKLREVLKTWLTASENPTWEAMIDALKSPVIEEAQLARKLQQKHCSSGQPPVDGQLTSPLEATPPPDTPPIPLTQPSSVGANSTELSLSAVDQPSQVPTNHIEGTQAQPLSLKEEIQQFEEKYEDLVDYVLNAFKTGEVSVLRVLKCLRQLPVSLKLHFGEFLQSQAARLSRVSSMDELFFILSPHWDFLNPSLLAYLAYRFGDEQTIRSVDEYLGELREFRMRTKIDNFIDKWTGMLPPDTQEIVMELGDNWREQSLEQLEEFRIEVSRKRCFEYYVMHLKRIKLSSVDAIFSLPGSVDIPSLDLESLCEFFQKHQVLRILLHGKCIFSLERQQEPQETALMVAARNGSVEIVRRLIDQGASVDLTNKDGKTALYLAARGGHEDVVDLLLEAKADPEVKNKVGDTALIVASHRGHSSVVRKLLQAGATVNTTKEDGSTALMVASYKGHSSVVRKLLQAGSTINTTREDGQTALHLAAQEGHEDVVELLLEANADLELNLKDGATALMVASYYGHSSVVKKLLQAGATVDTTKEDGYTALYLATQEGHEDVVEHLLEANADPELKLKGGGTALTVASFKGHSSVVRKLLQARAKVNTIKEDGCTALHLAAQEGHEDVVEHLLEANADPELKLKGGATALMVASFKGRSSVVRKLLQAGATIDTTDQDGRTALHLAAQKEHEDIVELLLEANADPDLQKIHIRREGTSLLAAVEYGHEGYRLRRKQTQTYRKWLDSQQWT